MLLAVMLTCSRPIVKHKIRLLLRKVIILRNGNKNKLYNRPTITLHVSLHIVIRSVVPIVKTSIPTICLTCDWLLLLQA